MVLEEGEPTWWVKDAKDHVHIVHVPLKGARSGVGKA